MDVTTSSPHRRCRRDPVRSLLLLASLLVLSGTEVPADPSSAEAEQPVPVPIRAVKVPGPLTDARIVEHVEFALRIGFNALWIPSSYAGRWLVKDDAPVPELFPEFLDLAERCKSEDVRIFLTVEPVADAQGAIVLSDTKTAKRIVRFLRLARRRAGVQDFVISFRGAGLRLTELTDLLAYGRIAAEAHVELTARIARKLGARERVWFAPAIFSDEHLDDPRLRYSEVLLESMVGLDPRVGIVWSGPRAASPSIDAADLSETRARFGGRPMVLDDLYPSNGSGERVPLALILGPLRGRSPEIAGEIAAYLSTPMGELGASRLALLTVAAFLLDPNGYDADDRWIVAMKRLAGDDPDLLRTLRTQAAEWGGWIGTSNYHTAFDDNPQTAAQSLRDPAAAAAWIWPTRTYPGRMKALSELGDTRFREDVLLTMARRLAVARAVPPVREIVSGADASEGKLDRLLAEIQSQRRDLASRPEVLMALDRFLYHAGLGPMLGEQGSPDEGSPSP